MQTHDNLCSFVVTSFIYNVRQPKSLIVQSDFDYWYVWFGYC